MIASTFAPTLFAISGWRPFCGKLRSCVFGRVFMPSLAMRFGLLPSSVCLSSQRQTGKIKHFDLRKHFFNRQSFAISQKKCIDVDAKPLRPLHCGQRHSVMRDANINESVVSLFLAGRPSAIFWAIRAIIIDTVKRISQRPIANVSQKVFENVPPLTYINAAPSITRERSVFGVVASLFDCLPQNINGSFGFAMCAVHEANVIQWSEKVK